MNEIIEKLRDRNALVNGLPWYFSFYDDKSGTVYDSLGIAQHDFENLEQLNKILDDEINNAAEQTKGC